jgi:SAM-dependent methyltransferase
MKKEPEYYDKQEIKATYEKLYDNGDFIKFPIADRHFIKALITKYDIHSDKSVLDVPCGTGKYAKYFHDCGVDVTGVDISRSAIDTARTEYPAVKFVLGDAMNPPFSDEEFDVLFCHGFSLFNEQDLEATRQFIEGAAGQITSGGLFVFGKTSSLSDKRTESGRMDHSLEVYTDFFSSLQSFDILGVYATVPHTFIPLGRLGFTDIVTRISARSAKLFNLPVRVYIILEKRSDL